MEDQDRRFPDRAPRRRHDRSRWAGAAAATVILVLASCRVSGGGELATPAAEVERVTTTTEIVTTTTEAETVATEPEPDPELDAPTALAVAATFWIEDFDDDVFDLTSEIARVEDSPSCFGEIVDQVPPADLIVGDEMYFGAGDSVVGSVVAGFGTTRDADAFEEALIDDGGHECFSDDLAEIDFVLDRVGTHGGGGEFSIHTDGEFAEADDRGRIGIVHLEVEAEETTIVFSTYLIHRYDHAVAVYMLHRTLPELDEDLIDVFEDAVDRSFDEIGVRVDENEWID